MDCTEVAKFIQVYLDGEFDEKDRVEFESHLKGCPKCQNQVDYERRFKEAIRARIPRPEAPEGLRERLVEAMGRQTERPVYQRILVWSSVPAVAALVLIVTFTWTVTSGFTPLVEKAVAQHASSPPVEVASNNSEEVENWFKAKVDFNVSLPRFAPQDFSLVGGRLSHLDKHHAALVRYRRGSTDFSLFVFLDPGGELGQTCHKVAQRTFCLAESRGYSVAVWRSRGVAYSLVGDLPPRQMLEVLSAAFEK